MQNVTAIGNKMTLQKWSEFLVIIYLQELQILKYIINQEINRGLFSKMLSLSSPTKHLCEYSQQTHITQKKKKNIIPFASIWTCTECHTTAWSNKIENLICICILHVEIHREVPYMTPHIELHMKTPRGYKYCISIIEIRIGRNDNWRQPNV